MREHFDLRIIDVYVSHYQQIKEGWGSLTKRTPKMKLQQAFILEVQMINNLCFDANLS